ncbi:MAG: CPBP family intramembrane metalloprotease [Deltaproteobacteria bacterium]|nr:CPBP family intramembrane metalloprotease [Deltaproteobacteria bacterium]
MTPAEPAAAPAIEAPPEPRKPEAWHAFMAFGVAMAATIALGAVVGVVLLVFHFDILKIAGRDPAAFQTRFMELYSRGPTVAITITLNELLIAAVALFAADMSGPSITERLRLGPSALPAWAYLVAPVGMLAAGDAASAIVRLIGLPSVSLPVFHEASHGAPATFGVLLVSGTIGAGFAEETLFRGYMASVLGGRWSRRAAILGTAICFGLMHLDLAHTPIAFAMGLYLGVIAERAGSIRVTMFAHAVNNGASFLLDRYSIDDVAALSTAAPSLSEPAALMVFAIVGALVCAGCLLLLLRPRTPSAAAATA